MNCIYVWQKAKKFNFFVTFVYCLILILDNLKQGIITLIKYFRNPTAYTHQHSEQSTQLRGESSRWHWCGCCSLFLRRITSRKTCVANILTWSFNTANLINHLKIPPSWWWSLEGIQIRDQQPPRQKYVRVDLTGFFRQLVKAFHLDSVAQCSQ